MKAIVTLGSNGRFTLPAAIRATLGLKQGDQLEVTVDESGRLLTVSPVPDLEELSSRISSSAKRRIPVTDVDAFYQENRRQSPGSGSDARLLTPDQMAPTRELGFVPGGPVPDSFSEPLPDDELNQWGSA
ncbi:AbrB/MazE/SpoVT family DNA-binding domain-containing protein [Cryobacterium sp. GrIS_2_6]|uniref:AbrB/MazE/SpoVT family DNA-binding domain-containing protein n=1 Tax=Cryobacterium sp. GrIS_2_6 TaxID=3162785 RepID=UPI002E07CA8D|nr:AbrB family looped-hinge helix DNA binding protein [Cryobacterium psychrotolerans]